MDYQVKNGVSSSQAREKLLDVAEKLFTEKGFVNTSVRDLTKEAGCNIAAVNYHFGGKDQLYKAMFQRHMDKVFAEQTDIIIEVMNSENPALELLLEKMITKALEPLASQNRRIPMLKLVVRESLNPHMNKNELIELEIFRSFAGQIQTALVKLVPGLTTEKALLSFYSLEGLILQPLLFYDFYSEVMGAVPIDELINHTVNFAAKGIRAAAKS